MTRVKVNIKLDDAGKYTIVLDADGKPLKQYSQLCYGDSEDAQKGVKDDPTESLKTKTGGSPLVGWVTV